MRFSLCRSTLLASLLLLRAAAAFPQHIERGPDRAGSAGLMNEGSGTAQLPASALAADGLEPRAGGWRFMLHGEVVAQALAESGSPHHRSRGVSSVNWLMLHAARPVARGSLALRTMVSAEPWTVRGCGYPDLLATGEVCVGDTIHDRQHPHDLFMELAASYEHQIGSTTRLHLYGGPVGEPALGPVTFLHRPSARGNPIAPIAHHWLDATHVSYGVVTVGVSSNRWTIDASAFNGREPDDRRTNIERAAWDSLSARATYALSSRHVVQASGGHLHDAEAGVGTLPRRDVNLLTASWIAAGDARRGRWSTTMAWSRRWGPASTSVGVRPQTSDAGLLEAALVRTRTSWFARAEVVGKAAHDLHADEFDPTVFIVGKLQAGGTRQLASRHGFTAAVGMTLSMSLVPAPLAPRYDGRLAPGGGIFLRLTPSAAPGPPTHAHAHRD
ncbi:MAG: hypothetical protein JSU08_07995 [Acidobacteria bacterium]|nr:hypothetical protein [Acidobacteriota bacterium]